MLTEKNKGQNHEIFVRVKDLTKRFGKTLAVDCVSFNVYKGEFLTLLGPSGCGKTTTLRCIAGFEFPEEGSIMIGGHIVTEAQKNLYFPPERRNYGMVFQSYAIWPHMTVAQNVAYGLKMRKAEGTEIKEKVQRVLDLVGLGDLGSKNATMLSGGQQQRVAVARALAYDPEILLFDEPLSNLDAKLRERMRIELKHLQSELDITTIYVTHDQVEAMVMSDRVIVMKDGRIQQIGPPKSIYDSPQTQFVADFIGTTNFVKGVIKEKLPDADFAKVELKSGKHTFILKCRIPESIHEGEVTLSLRPEDLRITDEVNGPEERNYLTGKLVQKIFTGNMYDCRVMVGDTEIRVNADRGLSKPEGEEIGLCIDPERCLCVIE